MEKQSVTVKGNSLPAYLNGRPRQMLVDAFQPEGSASTTPSNSDLFEISGIRVRPQVPTAPVTVRMAVRIAA